MRLMKNMIWIAIFSAANLWAQDVFTIEGGNIEPGGTASFNIYFQDVSGNNADTGTTNHGLFQLSLDSTPGLVTKVEFVRAGLIENNHVFAQQNTSNLGANLLEWSVIYQFEDVPFFQLDGPAPGDLIGQIILTVNADADGQTLTLTPSSRTFIQEEEGNLTISLGNGVEVVTAPITIGGGNQNPPTINSFVASPSSVTQGDSSTLSWQVSGADSVSINQGIGSVAAIGNRSVSPSQTTTYVLTAQNEAGSVNRQVSVAVSSQPQLAIDNFSISPSIITSGASANMLWSVTGATNVSINQGIGSVSNSGSQSISPQETTTYTITATDGTDTINAQATLTVNPASGGIRINTFEVTPAFITQGDNASLVWSVEGADQVSIDQGIGNVSPSGSRTLSPGSTTTYKLTASTASESVSQTVTLSVNAASTISITRFEASPRQVEPGQPVLLVWEVENATRVSIDNGVGSLSATGATSVNPIQTTTYTLTAENDTDPSVSATQTVTVQDEPLQIRSFSAGPQVINFGSVTTLSWEVSSADQVMLSRTPLGGETENLGEVQATGQFNDSPQADTRYTLTASDQDGSLSSSVDVTVLADDDLDISPASLRYTTFSVVQLLVANTIARTIPWEIVSKPDWLFIEPMSGSLDDEGVTIRIELLRELLAPGESRADVVIRAGGKDFSVSAVAGETRQVLPLIRAGGDHQTEIGIVSFEDLVNARLEIFNEDGSLARDPETFRLGNLESVTIQAPLLTTGRGWARVTTTNSPGNQIAAFANTSTTNGQELYAYPAAAPSESRIYVPHIAASSLFFTEGSLVNASGAPRTFEFDAGPETFPVGMLNDDEMTVFDFRDELMGGQLAGNGWGELRTNNETSRLAAVEVFGRDPEQTPDVRQAVGVGVDGVLGNRLIFPHLAADTTNFWTGVVIVNPNGEAVNLTYRIYDSNGGSVSAPGLSSVLNGGEKVTFLTDQQNQQLGSGAAWLEVEGDQPITGYMLFGSPLGSGGDFFSGFQSTKNGSTRLCFPYLDASLDDGGFTGVVLVNTEDTGTEITLSLVDSAGVIKDSQVQNLAGKQKFVALAGNLFSEPLARGDKIIASGETKLAGFEIYGVGRATLGGILAIEYE